MGRKPMYSKFWVRTINPVWAETVRTEIRNSCWNWFKKSKLWKSDNVFQAGRNEITKAAWDANKNEKEKYFEDLKAGLRAIVEIYPEFRTG